MEKQFDVTRITNDVNGNPRYVVHFLDMLTEEESKSSLLLWAGIAYDLALVRCAPSGGQKFHNRQYGGGIKFQSYNIQNQLNEVFARFEASRDYENAHHNMVLVVMNDFDLYQKAFAECVKVFQGKKQANYAFAEISQICREAAAKYKKRVSAKAVFIAACEVMLQCEEGAREKTKNS